MYLNRIQIAESFGVAESVVESWVRSESMPHIADRGRLLFDRAQVVQWAASRGLTTRAGFLTPTQSAFATGLELAPLLRAGGIHRDVAAGAVMDVLGAVINALPDATRSIKDLLHQRVCSPGGIVWAAIGGGFALPHLAARVALGRDTGTLALLMLREALTQVNSTPDKAPVTRLLFFIAPSPRAHLDLLGRLNCALKHEPVRNLILNDGSDSDIFAAIESAPGRSGNHTKPGVRP